MTGTGEHPIDWERLERLFGELMALPAADRAARLELLRSGETALARELASLLACAPLADRAFRQLPRAAAAVAAELVRSDSDSPPLDRPSGVWTDDHPGSVVAHYRIEGQLGRGGMGVVYRATDTRLNRPVALKFLPPHLWVDRRARERLLLEARAAAALDHPNICTVYEVGETPEGALFLAMAYYEGETLRERLARGALEIDAAVDVAAQAARALGAAHASGIVHRDVKPANLVLTSAGTVKLLDFGLARLADVTVTASGQTPGTIAYMSPEQVRGERVDARSDLWALGVVLFEMLTGRRPFRGDSEAAVLHEILHGDPPPPSRLRSDVPPMLDDIVARLLRRDLEERYASAAELLEDLEDLERVGSPEHGHPRRSRGRAPKFTGARWRGRRRVASLVGAAIVAAGVGAAAWLDHRDPPRANVASSVSGERILIADFATSGDDSTLGAVVSQALRMGLAHSAALRVVGAATVSGVLQRMRRAPDAPLDAGLAREVATREGIKAVIQGEVRRAGSGYLITAALEDAATGDRIEGWRVTADDSTEIPAAVDRLIADIRASGADPLASIDSAERPSPLTTSSLGALRKQREGLQAFFRSDYLRAITLFEEATALDPDFAVAHSLLGTALLAAGILDSRVPRAFRRAYDLREQLTESERHAVVALHAKHVLGDLPQAIDAFRNHVEVTRGTGAGIWYSSLADALAHRGQLREAEEVLQEARRLYPTPSNQTFLAALLLRRGDEVGARAVLEEARARRPRHARLVVALAFLEARTGDYAAAHAIVDTGLAGPGGRQAPVALAMLDATRGRVGEALRHLRELQQEHVARGLVFQAANMAATIGMLRLRTDGADAAVGEVERLVAARPTSATNRVSFPYHSVALFLASAGRPRRAERLLSEYMLVVPPELRGQDRWLEHRTLAALRLAQGRPRAALAELQTAASYVPLHVSPFDLPYVPIDHHPELARVYDRLRMPDSALAVYERYLALPELDRVNMDAFELGDALKRVAELHAARGDWRRAAMFYRRLAELWRDADPKPRAAARAAERAAALGAS